MAVIYAQTTAPWTKKDLIMPRVLIATSNLEVINVVYKLLVDGVFIEVKIIEEWRFNLGEDACLFDNDNEYKASHSDHEEMQGDPEINNNVDLFVEKIANEMAEEKRDTMLNMNDKQHTNKASESRPHVEEHETVADHPGSPISSVFESHIASSMPCVNKLIE